MAQILVLYDPTERLSLESELRVAGIREAKLPIADDLNAADIYKIAEKLAGMLLEQL